MCRGALVSIYDMLRCAHLYVLYCVFVLLLLHSSSSNSNSSSSSSVFVQVNHALPKRQRAFCFQTMVYTVHIRTSEYHI